MFLKMTVQRVRAAVTECISSNRNGLSYESIVWVVTEIIGRYDEDVETAVNKILIRGANLHIWHFTLDEFPGKWRMTYGDEEVRVVLLFKHL